MKLIDADKVMKLIPTEEYNARMVIANAPIVDVDSLNAKHEDIGYEKGYRDGYAEALEVTVDAEPVRHGYWILGQTMGHSWMKCSECCVSQDGQTATFTYCPNCGAKMREVEE